MTSEETQIPEELKGCYENLIVIDIGANLTNKKYGRDLDSVIQRAKDAGVQKIMVTGTSVRNSKEALRLTRLYPGTIYSTAGRIQNGPALLVQNYNHTEDRRKVDGYHVMSSAKDNVNETCAGEELRSPSLPSPQLITSAVT
ncbi:Deoxyribonuclease tatD [Papilio machaon]|uniref:Deoxyribonuclease TATDN1 n=1 Tax=Papilio machaon TaxID=76193 RepID=A0A194RGT4_PAPMA|nr:Deoxyribonuclease tatD [Papilio machaon]